MSSSHLKGQRAGPGAGGNLQRQFAPQQAKQAAASPSGGASTLPSFSGAATDAKKRPSGGRVVIADLGWGPIGPVIEDKWVRPNYAEITVDGST